MPCQTCVALRDSFLGGGKQLWLHGEAAPAGWGRGAVVAAADRGSGWRSCSALGRADCAVSCGGSGLAGCVVGPASQTIHVAISCRQLAGTLIPA